MYLDIIKNKFILIFIFNLSKEIKISEIQVNLIWNFASGTPLIEFDKIHGLHWLL